ncbi:MAG: DNA-binding transcriptional regulator Fis [Gammaproteobacteria bacterium]|nr:DNA-binding transcriptional regulator Fis [Gammaproteobacteria bacterium]
MSAAPQRAGLVGADERRKQPLASAVDTALTRYLQDLEGHLPTDLYEMVLCEVEQPLLRTVMQFTRGNQSLAAQILGLNRSTLRKKLAKYGLGR